MTDGTHQCCGQSWIDGCACPPSMNEPTPTGPAIALKLCPACGALPCDQSSDPALMLSAPVMAGYAMHYGGRCRDCADEAGICPMSGMPCGGRLKATQFVCEALEYGFKHDFVDPRYAIPTPTASGLEAAQDGEARAIAALRAIVWTTPRTDFQKHWFEEGKRALAAHSVVPSEGMREDGQLLDALRENSWDLRCFDRPTGGGDADIGWRVVGHWQAEPCERTVAEVYADDPREAIRAALRTDPAGEKSNG